MPSGTTNGAVWVSISAPMVGGVEVVVVVVRDHHRVELRQVGRAASAPDAVARGPSVVDGETRSLHTGSVSTQWPSISSRTVAWPSQVTASSPPRSPVAR